MTAGECVPRRRPIRRRCRVSGRSHSGARRPHALGMVQSSSAAGNTLAALTGSAWHSCLIETSL
jgi:hypothetical protein